MYFEFKKDEYKSARGTYSRLLNLFCRVCGEKILVYQKDGPGNLRRLYFDRIFSPKKWTNLESKPLNAVQILSCPKCKEDIGTPYIYKKENRKAFQIYQDALIKKIRKLKVG
ncbi:hypothetical protein J4421_01790 [Candidatus Woesearchaeota archaeon]|nr:hypothetical protein [Candidatus Woesearchaeota archaeon]